MLKTGLHPGGPLFINLDNKIYRTATDLAILDIFLVFDRTIDEQSDLFPAIGALRRYLDDLVDHDSGSIRMMRPLSVEK